jgi:twinkle protein
VVKTWSDFNIDLRNKTGIEVKVPCPECSPRRKKKNYPCLNVNTDKGVWHCWHCGWAGSLKSGEWNRPEIKKTYVKPTFVKAKKVDEVVEWFASRGIPAAVVERNQVTKGIAYFPQVEEEKPCILFPFLRGGEVINVKYRTRDKLFRMAAGAERLLYGIDDIDETLIWVEGEIDKLSIEVAGFTSCVSVPDGAPDPKTQNYSNKFDFLQEPVLAKVKTHIIAVDADEPGVRLQHELVRRLGREKCLVVSWPDDCKDANEVLTKHGADFLAECLAEAQPLPVEGTHKFSEVRDRIYQEYQYGAPQGLTTGWSTLDPHYRVMTGEWTLVTGIPGMGKSEWLDALAINLAKLHGWSFGMFSPESDPLEYHFERMAEKYVGKPFNDGPTERMNRAEVDMALTWIDQHFTALMPELPTVESLLEAAAQLVLRYGIRGLIIDPWNAIDHARDRGLREDEYISQMLSKVDRFCKAYQVHVWIVAHPFKLQKDKDGSYPVPTPYDVSGAAHWRNKAYNCITVHRDITSDDELVEIHVQKVKKQKANGRPGMVELLYDRLTGQYRDQSSVIPKHFAKKQRERARKAEKESAEKEF